jgi:predicted ArsR family transcriptional regulator
MTTAAQQISGVLSHGLPMTTNEIIEAVGRNPHTARHTLQKLAKEGRVERCGRKPARQFKNLRPYDQVEWRLVPKRGRRR